MSAKRSRFTVRGSRFAVRCEEALPSELRWPRMVNGEQRTVNGERRTQKNKAPIRDFPVGALAIEWFGLRTPKLSRSGRIPRRNYHR
jgi:hypothetical protein